MDSQYGKFKRKSGEGEEEEEVIRDGLIKSIG
jgi:hypothetical protein